MMIASKMKASLVFSSFLSLWSQNNGPMNAMAFSPNINGRVSQGLAMPNLKTAYFTRPSVTTKMTASPKATRVQLQPLRMSAVEPEEDSVDIAKKIELIGLGIWLVFISGFILENNFVGPFPEFMKTIPERVFFLNHMIGGMLFGGGIILTTSIEWLVAKNKNATVLQFWFDKVPLLDLIIVLPALTVSMISGTGLTIRRYGGLNNAPPHVDAIFWTLILFMGWWAATDLTTQGTALKAVNEMFEADQKGEETEVPAVVTNRHFSNVVSCFFILTLYSMMVLKPGTLFPWPWA